MSILPDWAPKDLNEIKTALLVSAYLSSKERAECEESLEELEKLCETYGLKTVGKLPCFLRKMEAKTFLGKGKVEEIATLAEQLKAHVVVFDNEISPHQQKELEALLKKPVIDRTELIIEVFGQRAQTREARLQVELAKVKYQFPRLKRMWTHLSRQAGTGGGSGAYLKGMGEKQIEVDRRLLRHRMQQLDKEIEEVKKHRQTQRLARARTGIPTFAIVGYTNAGKSTLLKALTNAEVLVEDKLFATLDTTTRKYTLPNKQEVLLIDTVGFIRKIPHTLVTAFRSTLEEALHTDILLHLIDISHPQAEVQAEAALHVLKELGIQTEHLITVLNKVDACHSPLIVQKFRVKYSKTVAISALRKQGFDELLELMIREISTMRKRMQLRIPQSHYSIVSELMREGRVFSCDYEENDIYLDIEIPSHLESKVQAFLQRSQK